MPVIVIAISIAQVPYVRASDIAAGDLVTLPSTPVFLYRRATTTFYYTSADLLQPTAPSPRWEMVVYDVFPSGEGHDTGNNSLTWTRQMRRALSGQLGDAPYEGTADVETAARFDSEASAAASRTRGTAALFVLPATSMFARDSGIRAFVQLAVKDPGELDVDGRTKGNAQRLGDALSAALTQGAKQGHTSVGIPFMFAPDKLGDTITREQSWIRLLRTASDLAPAAGMQTVVFGGFGLVPRSRETTDRAFAQAWREYRVTLPQSSELANQSIRVPALVALAAFLGSALRRRPFSARRLIAIGVLAPTIAVGALALVDSFKVLAAMPPFAAAATVIVACLLIGLFIDVVASYDPAKELSG